MAVLTAEQARQLALTHYRLADELRNRGQLGEAIASLRLALQLRPDFAEAHCELGNALLHAGQLEEAIACGRRAIALVPDFAEAHANLGAAYVRRADFAEALSSFDLAIACRADFAAAHWNRGLLLLLLGRYEEGWADCEWRYGAPSFLAAQPASSIPRWDGSRLEGRSLLLLSEQGFGDTIQFFRYLPLVHAPAAPGKIILKCPAALARLLKSNSDASTTIVVDSDELAAGYPRADCQLPLLSLPLKLGLPEPQPIRSPYLRADPALEKVWAERLGVGPAFRVGLAWKGSSGHEHDRERSVGIEKFLALASLPRVRFFSLQVDAGDGAPPLLAGCGVSDLTRHLKDFAETAALIANLDLVISVDTAVAHLAGALGRPVWVLLPHVPDWRWGLEREETPWYPTMRLFRQKLAGHWDEVIQRVMEELPALCAPRAG